MQRNTFRLAQSLIERGHRVDLVIPQFAGDYVAAIPRGVRLYRGRLPHTDRTFLRRVRRSGADVTALGVNPIGVAWTWAVCGRKHLGVRVKRKRSHYAATHILHRYLRRACPDVLVSALPVANAAAVCAVELTDRAVPVVVTVRGNVAAGYPPEWLAAARKFYTLADAVVAVSRGVAESVRRTLGVDAGRLHTIYNGVPADSIRRLAQEAVTHPWFADGQPPVILGVGREARAKDHPTLVQAFGLARREVDARLVILGKLSGPFRARLRSLARGYEVEEDLGFMEFDENPYRYMRRAALLALSSRWEGLPTVILEALACGTQVVSTDTPFGPREILGEWADLPPVGDAPAVARALVGTLRGTRPQRRLLLPRQDRRRLRRAVRGAGAALVSSPRNSPHNGCATRADDSCTWVATPVGRSTPPQSGQVGGSGTGPLRRTAERFRIRCRLAATGPKRSVRFPLQPRAASSSSVGNGQPTPSRASRCRHSVTVPTPMEHARAIGQCDSPARA